MQLRLTAAIAWTFCLLLFQPTAVLAEGLRVSPVTFEIPAPGATSNITLRNEGQRPITVQSRVFAWSQSGDETLQATRDVVVSPPITQLAPGAVQIVRIVRTTRAPIRGEEAYRIFIDELPDQSRRNNATVNFVTRLRLPLFFVQSDARNPLVKWRILQTGNQSWLEAVNRGDAHLKLSEVSLKAGNSDVYRQNGLFGYVLGQSTMRWRLSKQVNGSQLTLEAQTNMGPYRATLER